MRKDIVKYTDPATGEMTMAGVLIRFENGDVRTDKDGMRTRNEVTSIYETVKDTEHKAGIKTVTIPAGTPVIPANNLPSGGYWIQFTEELEILFSEEVQSWQRVYGFWVSESEVDISLPF